MKVSVIVTTYNNPIALKKVLDGLVIQRKVPDEVIIADDGSVDDTAQPIKDFSADSPFPVVHVWHKDKGFRAAKIRNEAIKACSGDYIILLDGDCVVNRHFVKDHLLLKEMGFFVQGKRLLISKDASWEFCTDKANAWSGLLMMGIKGHIKNKHHLIRLPLPIAIKNTKLKGIKSCNMGFFREDLLAVNGFNEDFIGWGREDSELAVRLFKYGLKRKEHPFMAICFHLWHPSYPMDTLAANDKILEETIKGAGYFCADGIVKK